MNWTLNKTVLLANITILIIIVILFLMDAHNRKEFADIHQQIDAISTIQAGTPTPIHMQG
jgi:hypothetical protein